MKSFMFSIAIVVLIAGSAYAKEEFNHNAAHLKQFKHQCMEATGNSELCNCAIKSLKHKVPPKFLGMVDHPDPRKKERVVTVIHDTHMANLAKEIAICESRFKVN